MLLHMLLFQIGGVQSTLMKHSSRSPSLFRLKVVYKIGENMIRLRKRSVIDKIPQAVWAVLLSAGLFQ